MTNLSVRASADLYDAIDCIRQNMVKGDGHIPFVSDAVRFAIMDTARRLMEESDPQRSNPLSNDNYI